MKHCLRWWFWLIMPRVCKRMKTVNEKSIMKMSCASCGSERRKARDWRVNTFFSGGGEKRGENFTNSRATAHKSSAKLVGRNKRFQLDVKHLLNFITQLEKWTSCCEFVEARKLRLVGGEGFSGSTCNAAPFEPGPSRPPNHNSCQNEKCSNHDDCLSNRPRWNWLHNQHASFTGMLVWNWFAYTNPK